MKALFVFAHPDDETFASGGTIVKLKSQGADVLLVTATRGEAGELGNPALTTTEKLGEVREEELRKAATHLGIDDVQFLGYIDGTLHEANFLKLTKQIGDILTKTTPDIVVTFDETGVSNHKDHIAISKATTQAFFEYMKNADKHVRLYHTAIPQSNLEKFQKNGLLHEPFGKMRGTPDEDITTKIYIKPFFDIKIRALKEHKTQHQDWERFLKRQFIADLDHEFFVLIAENHFI